MHIVNIDRINTVCLDKDNVVYTTIKMTTSAACAPRRKLQIINN